MAFVQGQTTAPKAEFKLTEFKKARQKAVKAELFDGSVSLSLP